MQRRVKAYGYLALLICSGALLAAFSHDVLFNVIFIFGTAFPFNLLPSGILPLPGLPPLPGITTEEQGTSNPIVYPLPGLPGIPLPPVTIGEEALYSDGSANIASVLNSDANARIIQPRIAAQPWVIVSPLGKNNGGDTRFPNNGANFGPDTLLTTTYGIQDALNTLNPVELLNGTFILNSPITCPTTSFIIVGQGDGTILKPTFATASTLFGCVGLTYASFAHFLVDFDLCLNNTPIIGATSPASSQSIIRIQDVTGFATTPQNVQSFATVPYFALIDGPVSLISDVAAINIAGIALNSGRHTLHGFYVLNAPDNAIALTVPNTENHAWYNISGVMIDDSAITPFDSPVLITLATGGSVNVHGNFNLSNIQVINAVPYTGACVQVSGATYNMLGGSITNLNIWNTGNVNGGAISVSSVIGFNLSNSFINGGISLGPSTGTGTTVINASNVTIGFPNSTNQVAISIRTGCDRCVFDRIRFLGTYQYCFSDQGTSYPSYVHITNCDFSGATFTSSIFAGAGAYWLVADNIGFNPNGFNAYNPGVPASGSGMSNPNVVRIRIYILTVSASASYTITDQHGNVSGPIPLAAGQEITLDPNETITPTYSVLTWTIYGE